MNRMSIAAVAAVTVFTSLAATLPGNNTPPKPLPKEIITAWENAGAEIGWMREVAYPYFVPTNEGTNNDLPAFQFSKWNEGALVNLPAPETAFALDFNFANATDGLLTEVSRFKALQSFGMRGGKIGRAHV